MAEAPFLQGEGRATDSWSEKVALWFHYFHPCWCFRSDLSPLRVERDQPLAYKSRSGDGKMAQRIRVLATEPWDPHGGRGEATLVSWPLAWIPTHTRPTVNQSINQPNQRGYRIDSLPPDHTPKPLGIQGQVDPGSVSMAKWAQGGKGT